MNLFSKERLYEVQPFSGQERNLVEGRLHFGDEANILTGITADVLSEDDFHFG